MVELNSGPQGCVNIPATLTTRTEETVRMAEDHTTTVTIPLTKGYETVVDVADLPLLAHLKWCASERRCKRTNRLLRVYATTSIKRRLVLMHVYLMQHPDVDVDHRDGNTLNNKRCNLRVATRTQNNANSRKRGGTSSRFKGVFLHRQTGKWTAQIAVDKVKRHLGLFRDECDAATAYNFAAVEAFGEFARVNLP